MADFDYLTIAGTDNPITFNKSLSGATAPPRIQWTTAGNELLTFTFSSNLSIPNGKTTYYTFNRPASSEYPKSLVFNFAAAAGQSNSQLANSLGNLLQSNWGSPTTYSVSVDNSNNTILTFNTNTTGYSNSTFNIATNTQQILICGTLLTGPTTGQIGIFSSALGNLFEYFNYSQLPLPSGITTVRSIVGFFAKASLGSYIVVANMTLANGNNRVVVYTSTNNARTWTSTVSLLFGGGATIALDATYDPVTDTIIVLGTSNIINVSTNGGTTWSSNRVISPPAPYNTINYINIFYYNNTLFGQTTQRDEGTSPLPHYIYSYDFGLTWTVQDITKNTDSMGVQSTVTYQTIPGLSGQPPAGSPYTSWEYSGYESGYLSLVNNNIYFPFQADVSSVNFRTFGGSPLISQTPLVYDSGLNKYSVGTNNTTNSFPPVSAVNNRNAVWLIPLVNQSGATNEDEWSIPFQAGPNTTLSNGLTLCGIQDNFNNAHHARGNYLITAFSAVYQGGNLNLYEVVSNTQYYKPSLSTMVSTGDQLISITPNTSAPGTYYIGTSTDGFNWQTMPYTGFPSYFAFGGRNIMLYAPGNTSPTTGSVNFNRTTTNPSTTKPRLAYFNTPATGNIWPGINYLYKGANTATTTITGFTLTTAKAVANANNPIANPTEGLIY